MTSVTSLDDIMKPRKMSKKPSMEYSNVSAASPAAVKEEYPDPNQIETPRSSGAMTPEEPDNKEKQKEKSGFGKICDIGRNEDPFTGM